MSGTTSATTYDNNFNLLRLVAATQVMLVHSLNHFDFVGPLVDFLKATPGVPVFFFVSGVLISTAYQRMHHRGDAAFFRNRVLRIYPGLVACVVVAVALVAATGYFAGKDIGVLRFVAWLVGQATFVQFYNPDFMRAFGVGVLHGALWTITVELQFYALVPLLFRLIVRRPTWLAVLFVASICANLYVHSQVDDRTFAIKLFYVTFVPWLYMFIAGFAVAYYAGLAAAIERAPAWMLLIGYVAAMTLIGGYTSNAQNSINPIAFAFLACLIYKLATARLPFLPQRFIRYVRREDLSYGLYLYHMPMINVLLFLGLFSAEASVAAVAVASLAAAAASWYAVEKPALRYKR